LNWEDALAYCESLDLGGHTDWRLPTIKELCSLVDHTIYDPAIDKDFFPDTMSSNYWSSTSGAYFPDGAWGISFYYGYNIGLLKSYDSYVRAVRGGQSGPFVNLNIRANGSDGPVDVPVGQTVRVTVSVDPCGHAGEQAEWWVAANTPFDPPADWFSYVLSDIWTPGILRCAVAPLFDLAPFEVLNMALPLGGYTFYFVLDDTVDGVPELEWMDSVEVNVVE
jgi:hypothetical protein